jgi:hypothetical protein
MPADEQVGIDLVREIAKAELGQAHGSGKGTPF